MKQPPNISLLLLYLILHVCDSGVQAQNCREVTVLDQSCIPSDPIKSGCNYQIEIYEDCPSGTVVLAVQGGDTAVQTGCSELLLDGGDLKLNTELDAEDASTFVCTEIIEEGDGYDATGILANIIDVNESPPTLIDVQPVETLNVAENIPIGSTLDEFFVGDEDVGEAATIRYTKDFGDASRMFDLEQVDSCTDHTCKFRLFTTAELDYESGMFYELLVTFTTSDSQGSASSVSVTFNIFLQDQPDTAPFWVQFEANVRVNEDDDNILSDIATVRARDGDIKINNKILYSIVPEDDVFEIGEESGTVSSKGPIDREQLESNFFTLSIKALEQAEDGSIPDEPNSNTQDMVIQILDVNDNVPEITNENTVIEMDELTGSISSSDLGQITITDMDEGASGTYDLEVSDTHLEMNPNFGSLISDSMLQAIYNDQDNLFDYETYPLEGMTFTITATEREDNSHTDTTTVTITLRDLNDNAPEFGTFETTVTTNENTAYGTELMIVSATDKDRSDENGTPSIRYYLENKCREYFSLDEESGKLTVSTITGLDYEQMTEIQCVCEARDRQGGQDYNSASVTVTIKLKDENDTPPQLTADSTVDVDENVEQQFVVMPFSATDLDTQPSLEFKLLYDPDTPDPVTGWFEVSSVECSGGEPTTVVCGELRVLGDVDRELDENTRIDSVSVIIQVTDLNTQYNEDKDTKPVTIFINDLNDEFPVFVVESYQNLSVLENQTVAQQIGTVYATDPDLNDLVTYSISENEYFDVDASTGALTVKQGELIDRETQNLIQVILYATDNADHTTEQSLDITVEDKNDNAPLFDPATCPAGIEVLEDKTTDFEVWTVSATDADIGEHATLQYWLANLQIPSNKNLSTPFAVDVNTGVVTVFIDVNAGRVLDRETEDSWPLTMRVNDLCKVNEAFCSVLYTECVVTVTVLDVNDEIPELKNNVTVEAGEELEANTLVPNSEVTATDADLVGTEASEIHYKQLQFFDNTGAEIDNPFVTEDISGQDASGNPQWSFRLRTVKALKNMYGDYTLSVNATDGPKEAPVHWNIITINVSITDYNDYTPEIIATGCLVDYNNVIIIEEDKYRANDWLPCRENVDNATLEYIDQDANDPNNVADLSILYSESIVYPEENYPAQLNYFYLKPLGGKQFGLYLNDSFPSLLDREKAYGYSLRVQAKDRGLGVQLTSFDWIHVNLTNKEDFDPIFCYIDPCYDEVTILENTLDDATFTNATDGDNYDTLQSRVYYYIVGSVEDDSTFFEIRNPELPILSPTKKFDREAKDSYTLFIQASNNATPPAPIDNIQNTDNTIVQITVMIGDDNDEIPEFASDVIFGSVLKPGSAGQEAVILIAEDKDLYKTLRYDFFGDVVWEPPSTNDITDVFNIGNNGLTGNVTLIQSPDSLSGHCIIGVRVTDEDPTHVDEATLQIFIVTDEHQVPFYFHNDVVNLQLHRQYIEEVLTNSYGYISQIDSITPVSGSNNNSAANSVIDVHFINSSDATQNIRANEPPGNIVDPNVIISMTSSGQIATELKQMFSEEGLDLYKIGESNVGSTNNDDDLLMFQILLGVSVLVLGSLVFLLIVAYIVRTRKLERKVKVLSTNTFGSQASGMNRTGGIAAAPNSNLFTGEGANPMWNADQNIFDNRDGGSISSGDSVLVGVEDNPEFSSYKMTALRESKDDIGGLPVDNTFVGAGGLTSNNPLFAELPAPIAGAPSNTASQSDDNASSVAGDLGVSNTNFTFG